MQIFNKRSLLPVLIAMMGLACVKDPQDIPPGLTTDPAFGMTAHFGNQPIHIDAGVDQWTFVPLVLDFDSIAIYSAVLSQNACIEQCPSSWTFNFYQAQGTTVNEEEKFKNTVHEGPVDFVLADTERDSFQVSISTHPDLFMNGLSFWQNPASDEVIYSNEYDETVGSNDIFNVCFQSTVFAGCQYNQCVYFKPSTLIPCLIHIEASVQNGRYIVLTAVPDGTPPYQIQWADGPSGSTIVVAAATPTQNIFANVSVTDANGNHAQLAQTIRLQDSIVDACYYPINIVSTPYTDHSLALAAGDVEISYMDGDGEVWSSTRGMQPEESYLQIHEVGYYELAPSGLPAYKTSLSFHVLLTNSATGESRWFDSDNAVIPLSHPN